MKWQPVNLVDKLSKAQLKTSTGLVILSEVKAILEADNKKDQDISKRLHHLDNVSQINTNVFNLDLLETHRIYHINAIKKICVDYRLRFLDSHYFKPEFPYETICKIKDLERLHQTTLEGFKIVAPAKLLKLKNADDPLLFVPLGNGYYYLVHKWGNDLHPMRKWFMKPFKTFENLLLTSIVVSFSLTYLLPHSTSTSDGPTFWILFLFMFKSVVGCIIYYAFSKGKNVSAESWNSQYYNG